MSKHTPGPWSSYGVFVRFGEAGGICLRDAPSPEANANLIAAAPDLLEALEVLKDAFIVAVGDKSPYARCALERPLAVIAKARGES